MNNFAEIVKIYKVQIELQMSGNVIMEEDKYIGLEEAAEYIGVKPVTLRGWLKKQKYEIPMYRIGKLWKFKKSELDKWIQSGRSSM